MTDLFMCCALTKERPSRAYLTCSRGGQDESVDAQKEYAERSQCRKLEQVALGRRPWAHPLARLTRSQRLAPLAPAANTSVQLTEP